MVGDSERDIAAASAAGGRPILVLTGNGTATAAALAERGTSPPTFANLGDVASFLIDELKGHSVG
jgi:phosphoglycolate phosphatase-like HAD superfamily hydrolase